MPIVDAEDVDLARAVGRILAEPVVAAVSHPPTAVSSMDGYACRSTDITSLPSRLNLIGASKPGAPFPGSITPETCVRIFTGAAVPLGADAIVQQEDANATESAVELAQRASPGQFIRPAGMDFVIGQSCVQPGRQLTVRDIALIASCGHASVRVRRKPRVAVFSTGDELVAPGSLRHRDHIMDANGLSLAASITSWGGDVTSIGIVPDRIDAIAAAIDAAIGVDLLVTSGGASVGDHDLVGSALASRGFELDFWKLAMRPGKPLLFGRLGQMPVLCMPGNPVSALVCALLFLRPSLAAMLGRIDDVPCPKMALLASRIPANDVREDYIRARIETDERGRLIADPYPVQDSGMVLTLAQSDALIRRMPFATAAVPGDKVEILDFGTYPGF